MEVRFIHVMAVVGQPAAKLALMDARLIQERTILANLPLHQTVLIPANQVAYVSQLMIYKPFRDTHADRELSAARLCQLRPPLLHAQLRPVIIVPIAHVMRETLLQPAAADPYICNVVRKHLHQQLLPTIALQRGDNATNIVVLQQEDPGR